MFINKNDEPIAGFKSDFYTKAVLIISVVGIFVIGFIGALYEYIKTIVDSF